MVIVAREDVRGQRTVRQSQTQASTVDPACKQRRHLASDFTPTKNASSLPFYFARKNYKCGMPRLMVARPCTLDTKIYVTKRENFEESIRASANDTVKLADPEAPTIVQELAGACLLSVAYKPSNSHVRGQIAKFSCYCMKTLRCFIHR